jgi:autotransporter-associated beta strand protein
MTARPIQWVFAITLAFAMWSGSARAQTTWTPSVLPGAPFPSDIVLTSATGSSNQFELTLRAGGSLARMRALQAGNKDVIPFGSDNILTSNHQWGLLAGTALDDGNTATDDRFFLRQSGGLPLRIAPLMQVESNPAAGRVDVHAVAQDQWNTHLQSAVEAKVSHLTRYETLADGSIKVRRILRFGNATVNGAPLDISAPYFEETLPFHVTNFNRLAERLNSSGSPQVFYSQGSNIPQNAQTDIASTSGYAVIYNNANAFNPAVMGVVFGKTQTAAPNQMVLNYSDNSTEISVRPGIQLTNAVPGAVLDFTYYLVPAYALNTALATRLNNLVAATPAPVVYPPGHVFTGELATIAQRLNDNLALSGKRSDRLGHDVTPAPVTARPMLLNGPEDDADIRARLIAFPQTPENVLQNHLYGTAAQKQAATNYFFRYPGSGDGNGLRTNYNTITARHMMWDQYRYDVALGLGYATQAQKDLMLSLTESFISSKSTHIKPEGAGGGNLALEAYIAIGLAGLNFPDHPDAQLWLSRSVTNVKKIVETYFPDGAGTESPRYHDWTLELLAIYLRALERRTGIDLYDEPGIRSALEWLIRFSSPPVSLASNKSVTPAWGDSTYSSNAGTHYYYNLGLFAPAYRERDPDFSARLMGWWIQNGRPRDVYSASTSGLTNILMLDSRLPDAPVRPNTSTYSPRIGHATLRSGSGTNDEFFATFKCGTQGAAHQDGDIGHLDLFAFGVPLALDSTSGPYDSVAFNPANAAHNTVRFNGAGAWDSVSGSFSAFGTSPSADYAVGDTNYGTVSNRHLVMMKGDYLVVWDETTASNYADWFFRVPGSATLDWQDHKVVSSTPWGVNLDVHFVLPAEPLVEPTHAGSFIPTGDATALRNTFASQATDPGAPGMFTMMGENRFGDGSTSRNPFPFQWLKYFSVRNGPTGTGDFLTVMHPRKVGVTPEITTELVSSSATAVTLRVTCNGRVDTIALTSTGATITKGSEPPVQFTKTWPQSGVSGAAAYVKSDFHTAPVTTLASSLATTGPVEVHTGELALGASNRIPDSANLMVKPGAAFNTATFNETVGTLIMNGGVLKGSGSLTASSIEWWGGIVTAPVSSNGNFLKKGGADWSRPANVTYSGDTVIDEGNLVFQPGSPALPGTGRVVLRDGTGLKLDGTSASISGLDVTGSANLTTGTGTLAITGSLTGTGVLANSGSLNLSAVTSVANTLTLQSNGLLTLPSGSLSVKRLIINGVTLPAGVAVSAATHPGQIAGPGTITPLEDIPVPTGLSGSATLGQISLTWNAVPGVPGYTVRRSTTPGGPYTDIATPAAASFNDALVTDGVVYHYVIAARDATGFSANSAEISITAIGPWYFDPNGTTAGSVANTGSYTWVSSSWTKTPGGAAAVEAWGPLRHAHFAATNPGSPLSYSVSLASFSGAAHGFQSLRVANGNVTFTGVPGNFYFTQPPVITADAGATIRFAQTGALAFNLNLKTVTFDGAGTTLVSPDTVIVNTGSIVKNGTGTLVLAAPNTYAGATTINGGTLRLAVTDLPALWLDATNSRTLVETDGAISQWSDANGRGTFVSQATAANRPALLSDATLAGPARSLVDFGAYIYNATTAPWMQFGASMTDIRALFWVGKTTNGNFLLGSTATDYHFHSGGAGLPIWSTQYASDRVRNGTTWLNGNPVTGTTTNMPSGLVRVAAFTTDKVNANTLGRDRSVRSGGIQPGEVMVFNTVLTTRQQTDIDAYLAKKWNGTGTGIGDRLPANTVVTLSNGGILDLTGINFQTLAGLEANDNSGTRVELGAAALTVSSPGSSSFDGIISGTGSLRKNGGGQFTLDGSNTYTGPTTVEGGTLVVGDSITSSVTVKSGALLVNNGTITGDVIIESGGTYLGEGTITGTITTSPPVVTITSPTVDNVVLPDLATDLQLTAAIVFNSAFGTPAVTWSMVSGPGTVTFENPDSATTTARFSATGSHTLRCTATVTVNGQLMQGSADRIVQPGGAVTNNFTATFREGVNGFTQAATFIRGDSVSWNSGARDQFLIGYNNSGGMRGLFAFDLAAVPSGATITSAAFDLWIAGAGTSTVDNLELRPLLKDFVEGSGNGSSETNGANTGADWNSRTGPTTANLWGVDGGQSGTDFSNTVIGTLAGFNTATTATGTKMGFTLAPAFVTEAGAALSAARPLRLMLTMAGDTSGSNRFARFASDDHATLAQRPQLTLNYTTGNPALPAVNPGTAPAAMSEIAASLEGSVGNASGGALWSLVSGPGDADFGDATQPATTVTFSAPGDYVLRLAASNSGGTVSRRLAVAVSAPLNAFAGWQELYWPGISDPDITSGPADPDADGESNLLEFATGQNPRSGTRSQTGVSFVPGGIDFTYQRNRDAFDSGYVFTVEYSDTLAPPWTPAGSGALVTDGPMQTLGATIPEGSGRHRFVRLRVTAP